jgi:DNA-3-methyladenine glycosylase
MKYKILPRTFYQRNTPEVARELIGKRLVRKLPDGRIISGIISETEAYQSDDPACHAHTRKTDRNKSLFGLPGHAYVYMSYGLHFCLNLVSYNNQEVKAGGVLIRAVIPEQGIDYMREQRNYISDAQLTNGPGKLAQAFSITKQFDGIDITQADSSIYITQAYSIKPEDIIITGRIGLSVAQETQWRFVLDAKAIRNFSTKL